MRSGYIREHEPIAIDDLADRDGDRPVEHRAVVGERVKLTALAALIDAWRKIGRAARDRIGGRRTIDPAASGSRT